MQKKTTTSPTRRLLERSIWMRNTSSIATLLALAWGCGSSGNGRQPGSEGTDTGGSSSVLSGGSNGVTAGGTVSVGGSSETAGGSSSGGGNVGTGGSSASGGSTASGGTDSSGGSNGSGASAGDGSSGSSSGGTSGGVSDKSDLPIAVGPDDLPQPSGSEANLSVLHWAGFDGAVSYTLDDTSPSHIENWAAIKAKNVPVTYYVVSSNNWIGSYDATLQDLVDSGSELGNHTAHHCNFNAACNGVGAGTADSEIDNCSSYIENTLGQDGVYTMAYPLGDTGYKTDAQERFFLARGTGGGMIAPNDSTDPFNLPTFGASGGEAASTFNGQIDTAKSQGKWVTFLFHSILPENWYAGVNLSTITESIDHAKGLGDVWIGTLRDVGAYWRAEKMLNDITPSDSSGTLTWSWTLPTHFPPGKFLRVTVDGGALSQGGSDLEWNGHGFYEVALDESPLVWTPP